MNFEFKDVIYLIVLVGGLLSSYFINNSTLDRRISILETRYSIIERKFDKVIESQEKMENKIDELAKTIYIYMGQQMQEE